MDLAFNTLGMMLSGHLVDVVQVVFLVRLARFAALFVFGLFVIVIPAAGRSTSPTRRSTGRFVVSPTPAPSTITAASTSIVRVVFLWISLFLWISRILIAFPAILLVSPFVSTISIRLFIIGICRIPHPREYIHTVNIRRYLPFNNII
jgi:hypothetical protein